MLKRPPNGPYLEDGSSELELGSDPDLDDLRAGDILMTPSTWARNNAINGKSPQVRDLICTNGSLVGGISKGGNVAVNCRDISNEVRATLVGLRREKKEDLNLVRPGVGQALSRLKLHIDVSLENLFAAKDVAVFLEGGGRGICFAIPHDKFAGIGLDGKYSIFPDLKELCDIVADPVAYHCTLQEYLSLSRIKWLLALKGRLEEYVRDYVASHIKVNKCHFLDGGYDVSFRDVYLPKMVIEWVHDVVDGLLKLKVYFRYDDARYFMLRGAKFELS